MRFVCRETVKTAAERSVSSAQFSGEESVPAPSLGSYRQSKACARRDTGTDRANKGQMKQTEEA